MSTTPTECATTDRLHSQVGRALRASRHAAFRFASLGSVFAVLSAAAAAEVRVVGTTDKGPTTYAQGDKITFSIKLLEDGQPVAGRKLTWERKGDDGTVLRGEAVSVAEGAEIVTSMAKPGFVSLDVAAYDAEGQPCKDAKGQPIAFHGGAGVAVDQLAGVPEPADFDAFWQRQKDALAEVPLKFELTPAGGQNAALEVFDLKVDCAGGKPVSGYFARPKGAAPKSLPAIVSFHGYGIRSASKPEGNAARGMLALDINAHGIENGQPEEFYKQLGAAELQSYGFKGNDVPENSYFRGMMMRVLRALEFMKAQPEWDGKNLVVVGGSQGGLQALTAAGLDPQVTFCLASKPWMCDLSGITLGRLKGWRPDLAAGLVYFDPANHAKRIKCPVSLDAGLGDYTCPPSSVTAVYNTLSGPKTLVYIQGATHMYNPPNSPNAWAALNPVLTKIVAPPKPQEAPQP